jgi:hypothetical protein
VGVAWLLLDERRREAGDEVVRPRRLCVDVRVPVRRERLRQRVRTVVRGQDGAEIGPLVPVRARPAVDVHVDAGARVVVGGQLSADGQRLRRRGIRSAEGDRQLGRLRPGRPRSGSTDCRRRRWRGSCAIPRCARPARTPARPRRRRTRPRPSRAASRCTSSPCRPSTRRRRARKVRLHPEVVRLSELGRR